MEHTVPLEERANNIFSRFCERLAKIDLRAAVAVPAVIGGVVAMYGIGLEVHGQSELLRQGGSAALDAYTTAMQSNPVDSVVEYTKLAFAGELPSFGGNTQGVGVAIAYVGPAVASAVVVLERGFETVKKFLDEKLRKRTAIEGAKQLREANEISLAAIYAAAYSDDPLAGRPELARALRLEEEAYKKLASVDIEQAKALVAAERNNIEGNFPLKDSIRFSEAKLAAAVQKLNAEASAGNRKEIFRSENEQALPIQRSTVTAELLGGSIALKAMEQDNRTGFYAEGRQRGMQDQISEDNTATLRLRP